MSQLERLARVPTLRELQPLDVLRDPIKSSLIFPKIGLFDGELTKPPGPLQSVGRNRSLQYGALNLNQLQSKPPPLEKTRGAAPISS